jgi:repressor LexA
LAKCGPDGFFIDENVIERIPIATSLLRFPASEAFIVEAIGDSMEPKIKSHDLVIARVSEYAENNDLIVCMHESKAIIKKFIRIKENIALVSLNEKYQTILPENNFKICGLVKNIISTI